MDIREIESKSILSKQSSGFLKPENAEWPNIMTHSLSPYTGCDFGKTYCGSFCYAQYLASWSQVYTPQGITWGNTVVVKTNAATVLENDLKRMTPEKRNLLRIFMATTTDPYQAVEGRTTLPSGKPGQISRQCLEKFAEYDDLGVVLIHTRSPLVKRDFEILRSRPYFWLAMSIETDLQEEVEKLGYPGTPLSVRMKTIQAAAKLGINTQISVSPCLPFSKDFARKLIDTGVKRVVVDNFVEGDGSRGIRTGNSPFAQKAKFDWRNGQYAYDLLMAGAELGAPGEMEFVWSSTGFASVPHHYVEQVKRLPLF